MSDRIEKVIEILAPLSKVWLALTDYEQFGLWFKVKLDQPFESGKPSTGHMTVPGYEHVLWTALVVGIEPETYFSYTWHPYAIDPNVDYSGETATLVEFRLEEIATGTPHGDRVRLRQRTQSSSRRGDADGRFRLGTTGGKHKELC